MRQLRGICAALMTLMLLVNSQLPGKTPPLSDDAKLAQLFETWLQEEGKFAPLEATQRGDHRFATALDDIRPQHAQVVKERAHRQIDLLNQTLDAQRLSRDGQIDREIWLDALRYTIWNAENENPWAHDPRLYVDLFSASTYLLLTQSSQSPAENVRAAVARMQQMPKLAAAAQANLRHPPKILTEIALRRAKGAVGYYSSDIFALAGETKQLSELTDASKIAVQSLQRFITLLEQKVLPEADGDWRLGKEKFAQKLIMELNAGLTAEEVIRMAESEAERVEREMAVLARQIWSQLFPKRPVPVDDPAGRRAMVRQVMAELAKNHGDDKSLLADAKQTVTEIKAMIRAKDILTLPAPDTCQVLEMPEFQRGFSVAYLNPSPPLDPKANAVYAISPPPASWTPRQRQSYFEEYNRSMLKILTIHEAYPGHYVQLAYSNRHPSKIRKVLSSGVFAEGWAVYTEQMMLDQGFGEGDLALRLHQLKFYLRAVINALLDYRMHCSNLSDAGALELLTQRAFQSEGEALGKIDRAKQSSCQLSTYFVGRMAFYRLRQQVQQQRGEAFNLGRYHEEVLSHGTLPVKYLPELLGVK
jgi:uncharacterized protein (DUF885 family)